LWDRERERERGRERERERERERGSYLDVWMIPSLLRSLALRNKVFQSVGKLALSTA
jgi:hypothetical protein